MNPEQLISGIHPGHRYRDRSSQPLVTGRFVAQRSDKSLTACTEQERLAERVKQRQGVQQRQVFGHGLAEADTRVENDALARYTRFDRSIARRAEPVEHVEDDVAVVSIRVEIVTFPGGMHQNDRHAARSSKIQAAGVVAQGGNVVDQMSPACQRGFHYSWPARVDADRGAHRDAMLDRRYDTRDLVAFPDRRGARAGALAS